MNRDPVRMREDISLPAALREDLERLSLLTPAFDVERGLMRLEAAVEAEEEHHEAAERVVQASPSPSWTPEISAQEASPAGRPKSSRRRLFYACQAASVGLLFAIGIWGSFSLSPSAALELEIAQPLPSGWDAALSSHLLLPLLVDREPSPPRPLNNRKLVASRAKRQDISADSAMLWPSQKTSKGVSQERPKAPGKGSLLPERAVFAHKLLGDDLPAPPPCRFSTKGCGSEAPPSSTAGAQASPPSRDIAPGSPKAATALRQICGKLIRLNCSRNELTRD